MSARRTAALAGVTAVLLLGGGWALTRDEKQGAEPATQQPTVAQAATPTASPAPTPVGAADGLTEAQAQRLEAALSSQDPASVTSVFARAVADDYAGTADAVLPAGSVVSVDEAAFRPEGETATVPVTVTGPEPGSWLLLLVREDGQWRAYGTQPL